MTGPATSAPALRLYPSTPAPHGVETSPIVLFQAAAPYRPTCPAPPFMPPAGVVVDLDIIGRYTSEGFVYVGRPGFLPPKEPSAASSAPSSRCGAVRCGAVRCGAVRCGAVRCGAVRCGAVRCGAVRCGAVRRTRSSIAVRSSKHCCGLCSGVLVIYSMPQPEDWLGRQLARTDDLFVLSPVDGF